MADRSISRARGASKPSAAALLQLVADVLDPDNVERYAAQHDKRYHDACVELTGRVSGICDQLNPSRYSWAATRLRELAGVPGERA